MNDVTGLDVFFRPFDDVLVEDRHFVPEGVGLELALVVLAAIFGGKLAFQLFEEWRTLFGQVADLSAAQAAEIRKSIPFSPALPPKDMVSAALFAIHTYNAFVMKMLAAEIVAQYGRTAYPDFCEHLLGKDDDQLLSLLDTEVEQGAVF